MGDAAAYVGMNRCLNLLQRLWSGVDGTGCRLESIAMYEKEERSIVVSI